MDGTGRGRITVEAWARQWLAAQTGLKPSTLSRYRSPVRAQILPRWGQRRLADVTHAEVAAWVANLVAGGLAPATVRQAHRVLALILSLAVRDGRIPRNAAAGVPLPRARRADPCFLTRQEVERLCQSRLLSGMSAASTNAPRRILCSWASAREPLASSRRSCSLTPQAAPKI